MWLGRIFGRGAAGRTGVPGASFAEPAPPARRGFAEDLGGGELRGVSRLLRSGEGESGAGWSGASPRHGRSAGDAPFASTGPQGHRGRMREKLLERGPDALADYELLEMLLFFAFKKGDTKPLAKSLINRYGSFAAVLAAPQAELMATRGLGEHSVAALKLVQASALRLAKAEAMEQPVLNNWDRLLVCNKALPRRRRVSRRPCNAAFFRASTVPGRPTRAGYFARRGG